MIESLEHRRLCAAVRHSRPVFNVDAGTLRISGSIGNDVIVVGGSSGQVTLGLNGHYMTIRRPVRRAVIYGGAGNDRIACGAGFDYTIDDDDGEGPPVLAMFPLYADGGTGRDTLYGGDNGSTLLGGAGNDRLGGMRYYSQGTATTYMDGGPGNDTLRFGNVMHGGSGDDVATIDSFYGSPDFTSGLERQYDLHDNNYGIGESIGNKTDLTTRNGRLVLSYTADGYFERSISGAYVRDDGRIGVTVTRDGRPPLPETHWTVSFSDRQTERARRRGIVLSFVGAAEERLVLLPTTA